MEELLQSYEESYEKIKSRIRELSLNAEKQEAEAMLVSRRQYLLYTELWEMERTMGEIRAHLRKKPGTGRPDQAVAPKAS